jgi:type IX secretion system PorP/SprF family membrane protein
MINLKNTLKILIIIFTTPVIAQQEASFTQYRNHMNIINPAYVSIDARTSITSTIRDQWTGVKNAPLTQAVSFGISPGKNLGIGISILNNENFVEKENLVTIDFSYKLNINDNAKLYFGIKAGGNFYKLNSSGLKTYNVTPDPALGNLDTFTPNVGLGLLLKGNKYFISFSSPKILNTERAKNENGYASVATDKPHIYFSAGYDIDIYSVNTDLVLKPSLMVRYVKNVPVSLDLTTMLQIEKNFEIGAMYRSDKAVGVIADIKINKKLLLGYSYEYSTSAYLGSDQNTYELLLNYVFN